MIRVYVDTNIDASVLLLVDASTKIADLKKQVEGHIAQEYSGVPVRAGEMKIERMNCLFDPISPSRSRENCFTVPDGYDVGSIATDGIAKLFAEYQPAAPAKGRAFVTPVPGDRKRGRVVPVENSDKIEKKKKMKKSDAKEAPVGDAREKVDKVQKLGELGTSVETVFESGSLQRTPNSKTLKNQKKREQRKRRRESAKLALEEEKPMQPAGEQREGKQKEKTKEKVNGNALVGSDVSKQAVEVKDHGKTGKVGQQSPKKVTPVGKGEETGKTSLKKKGQPLGDTGAHNKLNSSSSSSSESSSSSDEEAVKPVEPPKAKSNTMAQQKNKVPEIPKKGKTTKDLPKPKAPPATTKLDSSSSSLSSESSSSSDSEGPKEPSKVKLRAVPEEKQKEKDIPKKTEQKLNKVSKMKTAGKSKIAEVPPEPKLPSSSSSSESSKSTSSSSDSKDEPMEAPKKNFQAEIVNQKTKEKKVMKSKETMHVAKPAPPLVVAKDPSSSSSSSSESSSSSSASEEIVPESTKKQKALTKTDKSGEKPETVMASNRKHVQEAISESSTSEDSSTSDSASSSGSESEESKEDEQQILTPSGKFDESDGGILKHLLASASQPDASKVCVADLKKSAKLEQEQDDLRKKLESENKTYQWQKPFSSFSRESLLKLCRMMVRDAVNQERKARGLEEALATKLYKDENRPDWWPLHKFSASSFDKKKDAVAVYNATRKVLSAIYRVDLQH